MDSKPEIDQDFVSELRALELWAEGNLWEVPIMLPSMLGAAADFIEEVINKKNEEQDCMGLNCSGNSAGTDSAVGGAEI